MIPYHIASDLIQEEIRERTREAERNQLASAVRAAAAPAPHRRQARPLVALGRLVRRLAIAA